MTRDEILINLQKYFGIHELVDATTKKQHGERAWKFFDTDLLRVMLTIREGIGKPITVNTSSLQQRGLRTNICDIVKGKTNTGKLYLSAHVLGKALDFDVRGYKAEEVRNWIIDNQDKIHCKIRLEHKKNGTPISWVHLDTIHETHNPKVYLFNV